MSSAQYDGPSVSPIIYYPVLYLSLPVLIPVQYAVPLYFWYTFDPLRRSEIRTRSDLSLNKSTAEPNGNLKYQWSFVRISPCSQLLINVFDTFPPFRSFIKKRVMDKSGYTHPFFRQSGGW